MNIKLILAAALLFLSVVVPAFGQAISGDVTGIVSDASGAVIPGVVVTIQNDQTAVSTTATSDPNGVYRFFNLPIGVYTLKAVAQGFGQATQKGLRVELSNTLTANITMQVSATTTTVDVSEASAGIDTTTAQLMTSFDTRTVQEIPTTSQGSGIFN